MNKKILILAAALILPMTASAFPSDGNYDTPPEHKLDHMSKELLLSPEQKTKLEAIFKEQHEKFRAIHEESHNRLKEVLNAEQLAKWEQMKKQHQDKRREMMKEHRKPNP
jgi:Spy/CpxP family protein refolding chaperone